MPISTSTTSSRARPAPAHLRAWRAPSARAVGARRTFRAGVKTIDPRIKKLVGSVGILVFLALYVWGATVVSDFLPAKGVARPIFFVCAGLLWGVPLLPFITWMNREGPTETLRRDRRCPD